VSTTPLLKDPYKLHHHEFAPLKLISQRLFMKDAGIDFKEVRYAYDETWPKISKILQEQGVTRTGKVPAVEYQGLILTQVCYNLFSFTAVDWILIWILAYPNLTLPC
jgi:hypothetical protein